VRPGWVELKRRDDEACDNVIKIGDALGAERRAHARTRRRLVELRRAVRFFLDGYPDREWEGLLHEQGCPGVRDREDEREPGTCRCDGDEQTRLVKHALRASDGRRR